MNANSYNLSSAVNAIVKVGTKRVHFVELEIEQIYGDHHHFRLQLDHDTAGKTFMHDPIEQIGYDRQVCHNRSSARK